MLNVADAFATGDGSLIYLLQTKDGVEWRCPFESSPLFFSYIDGIEFCKPFNAFNIKDVFRVVARLGGAAEDSSWQVASSAAQPPLLLPRHFKERLERSRLDRHIEVVALEMDEAKRAMALLVRQEDRDADQVARQCAKDARAAAVVQRIDDDFERERERASEAKQRGVRKWSSHALARAKQHVRASASSVKTARRAEQRARQRARRVEQPEASLSNTAVPVQEHQPAQQARTRTVAQRDHKALVNRQRLERKVACEAARAAAAAERLEHKRSSEAARDAADAERTRVASAEAKRVADKEECGKARKRQAVWQQRQEQKRERNSARRAAQRRQLDVEPRKPSPGRPAPWQMRARVRQAQAADALQRLAAEAQRAAAAEAVARAAVKAEALRVAAEAAKVECDALITRLVTELVADAVAAVARAEAEDDAQDEAYLKRQSAIAKAAEERKCAAQALARDRALVATLSARLGDLEAQVALARETLYAAGGVAAQLVRAHGEYWSSMPLVLPPGAAVGFRVFVGVFTAALVVCVRNVLVAFAQFALALALSHELSRELTRAANDAALRIQQSIVDDNKRLASSRCRHCGDACKTSAYCRQLAGSIADELEAFERQLARGVPRGPRHTHRVPRVTAHELGDQRELRTRAEQLCSQLLLLENAYQQPNLNSARLLRDAYHKLRLESAAFLLDAYNARRRHVLYGRKCARQSAYASANEVAKAAVRAATEAAAIGAVRSARVRVVRAVAALQRARLAMPPALLEEDDDDNDHGLCKESANRCRVELALQLEVALTVLSERSAALVEANRALAAIMAPPPLTSSPSLSRFSPPPPPTPMLLAARGIRPTGMPEVSYDELRCLDAGIPCSVAESVVAAAAAAAADADAAAAASKAMLAAAPGAILAAKHALVTAAVVLEQCPVPAVRALRSLRLLRSCVPRDSANALRLEGVRTRLQVAVLCKLLDAEQLQQHLDEAKAAADTAAAAALAQDHSAAGVAAVAALSRQVAVDMLSKRPPFGPLSVNSSAVQRKWLALRQGGAFGLHRGGAAVPCTMRLASLCDTYAELMGAIRACRQRRMQLRLGDERTIDLPFEDAAFVLCTASTSRYSVLLHTVQFMSICGVTATETAAEIELTLHLDDGKSVCLSAPNNEATRAWRDMLEQFVSDGSGQHVVFRDGDADAVAAERASDAKRVAAGAATVAPSVAPVTGVADQQPHAELKAQRVVADADAALVAARVVAALVEAIVFAGEPVLAALSAAALPRPSKAALARQQRAVAAKQRTAAALADIAADAVRDKACKEQRATDRAARRAGADKRADARKDKRFEARKARREALRRVAVALARERARLLRRTAVCVAARKARHTARRRVRRAAVRAAAAENHTVVVSRRLMRARAKSVVPVGALCAGTGASNGRACCVPAPLRLEAHEQTWRCDLCNDGCDLCNEGGDLCNDGGDDAPCACRRLREVANYRQRRVAARQVARAAKRQARAGAGVSNPDASNSGSGMLGGGGDDDGGGVKRTFAEVEAEGDGEGHEDDDEDDDEEDADDVAFVVGDDEPDSESDGDNAPMPEVVEPTKAELAKQAKAARRTIVRNAKKVAKNIAKKIAQESVGPKQKKARIPRSAAAKAARAPRTAAANAARAPRSKLSEVKNATHQADYRAQKAAATATAEAAARIGLHVDMPDAPTAAQLKLARVNPAAAVLLFADTTGSEALHAAKPLDYTDPSGSQDMDDSSPSALPPTSPPSSPPASSTPPSSPRAPAQARAPSYRHLVDKVTAIIAESGLGIADAARIVRAWTKVFDVNQKLHSCAACGSRALNTTYTQQKLAFFEPLKLSREQLDDFRRLDKYRMLRSVWINDAESWQERAERRQQAEANAAAKRAGTALPHKLLVQSPDYDADHYYLHPELVDTHVDGAVVPPVAMVCKPCELALRKGAVPRFSVATCDYGHEQRYELLGVPKLTPFAASLISGVRRYSVLHKFDAPQELKFPWKLNGHAIHFQHDAPLKTVEALPHLDGLSRRVNVVYMGKDGARHDILKRAVRQDLYVNVDELLATLDMLVCTDATFQHRHKVRTDADAIRAQIELAYERIERGAHCLSAAAATAHVRSEASDTTGAREVRDEVDTGVDAGVAAAGAAAGEPHALEISSQSSVVRSATIGAVISGTTASNVFRAVERAVWSADELKAFAQDGESRASVDKLLVAESHAQQADAAAAAAALADVAPASKAPASASSSVFVSSRAAAAAGLGSAPVAAAATAAVADDYDVDDDDDVDDGDKDPQRKHAVRSSRSAQPLNEFNVEERHRLFVEGYPRLFPFGTVSELGNKFDTAHFTHWLTQYSNVFAHDAAFIYTLADQVMRFKTVQSVARVGSHPTHMQRLGEFVKDKMSLPKLAAAIKNPRGALAKEVMARIAPFLRLTGRSIPFSKSELDNGMTLMYAHCHKYGLPSSFLTVGPDDTNSTLVIRLSCRTSDNHSFPAWLGDLSAALQRGDPKLVKCAAAAGGDDDMDAVEPPTVELLRIGSQELVERCNANPVAATQVYNELLDSVYRILLGVAPGSDGRAPTVPLGERERGVCGGVTRAAFGVTETQKRDALHCHLVVWTTGVTPELAQSISSHPDLERAACAALDKVYTSSVGLCVLAQYMLDKMSPVALRRRAVRAQHSNCPVPVECPGRAQYLKYVAEGGDDMHGDESDQCACATYAWSTDSCAEHDLYDYRVNNGFSTGQNMHSHRGGLLTLGTCARSAPPPKVRAPAKPGAAAKGAAAASAAPAAPAKPKTSAFSDGCRLAMGRVCVPATCMCGIELDRDNDTRFAYVERVKHSDRAAQRAREFTDRFNLLTVLPMQPTERSQEYVAFDLKRELYWGDQTCVRQEDQRDVYREQCRASNLLAPEAAPTTWAELKLLLDYDNEHYERRVEGKALLYAQLEHVSKTRPELFAKLVGLLGQMNGAVVCTSALAMSCVASNCACYFLGNAHQSKRAMLYLLKYLNKGRTDLSSLFVEINDARRKMVNFPSKAKDVGTPSRTGKHLLAILLNRMSVLQQLSSTQAVSVILDRSSVHSTEKPVYVFVKDAVARIQQLRADHELSEYEGDDGGDDDDDNVDAGGSGYDEGERRSSHEPLNVDEEEEDDEDDAAVDADDAAAAAAEADDAAEAGDFADQENDDDDFDSDADDARRPNRAFRSGDDVPEVDVKDEVATREPAKFAGASIFKVHDAATGKTKNISVAQYILHKHRGEELRDLHLAEYCCLVMAVPRKNTEAKADDDMDADDEVEDEGDAEDDADADAQVDAANVDMAAPAKKKLKRRTANGRFRFAPECPLFESHEQQLVCKQRMMVAAGGPPPRCPSALVAGGRAPSATWWREANKFAHYMLALFSPTWTRADSKRDASFVHGMPRALTGHRSAHEALQAFMAENVRSFRGRSVNTVIGNLSLHLGKYESSSRVRAEKRMFSAHRARGVLPWALEEVEPSVCNFCSPGYAKSLANSICSLPLDANNLQKITTVDVSDAFRRRIGRATGLVGVVRNAGDDDNEGGCGGKDAYGHTAAERDAAAEFSSELGALYAMSAAAIDGGASAMTQAKQDAAKLVRDAKTIDRNDALRARANALFAIPHETSAVDVGGVGVDAPASVAVSRTEADAMLQRCQPDRRARVVNNAIHAARGEPFKAVGGAPRVNSAVDVAFAALQEAREVQAATREAVDRATALLAAEKRVVRHAGLRDALATKQATATAADRALRAATRAHAQALLAAQAAGAALAQQQHHAAQQPSKTSPAQFAELQRARTYVAAYLAWLRTDQKGPAPPPYRLLLFGGPGSGKSWLTNAIADVFRAAHLGVACTAYQGSAASLLTGGMTLNNAFELPFTKSREPAGDFAAKEKCNDSFSRVDAPTLNKLRERHTARDPTTHLLVIDEVSTCGCVMMGEVFRRCELLDSTRQADDAESRSIGGMACILIGDMDQLPAFGAVGEPLYKEMLKNFVDSAHPVTVPVTPSELAVKEFAGFRMLALTQQQRCDDAEYAAMLTRIKAGTQPFDRAFREKYLPLLTAADLANDPLFAQAPVVCSTNEAVDAFALPLARQFARAAETFVVTWDIELGGEAMKQATAEERAAMCEHNSHLRGHFVRGAPGSIVENLNPGAGFANGSPVRMHSFTFSDANWKLYGRIITNMLSTATVGSTVHLPCEPEYINVVPLTNSTAASRAAWPRELNLVAQPGDGDGVVGDEVIVPIKRRKNPVSYKLLPLPDKYPIENKGWVTPHEHGVRLNLSTTYHKVQGRTLDRIILFIDEHDTNFNYAAFLVALSRVRHGAHVRVIGMNAADVDPFAAVERMFRKPGLFRFFAGYGADGMFDADRVRRFDRAVAERSRRSTTKTREWDSYAFLNPASRDATVVVDPIDDEFVLNAMVRAMRKEVELTTTATARRVANSAKHGVQKPKVVAKHASTAAEKDAAAQQTFGKVAGAFNPKAPVAVAKAPAKALTKVSVKVTAPAKAAAPTAATAPAKVKSTAPKVKAKVSAIDDEDDQDADFQAAAAANMAEVPVNAAQVNAREALRIAASAEQKAAWRVRIDERITADRAALHALAVGVLHPFERLARRQHQESVTPPQLQTFWELPGVAQSLGHLRYTGAKASLGLFDTLKWRLQGWMTNTCPYDSALVEAHRLLCTNAPLLALLRRAADDGTASERAAARVLLDMHAFASARMWEAARLVVVRFFLFECSEYDAVQGFSWPAANGELNLQAGCHFVDSLFSRAGASIASVTLETVFTCDQGAACKRGVATLTEQTAYVTHAPSVGKVADNANATFARRLKVVLCGGAQRGCGARLKVNGNYEGPACTGRVQSVVRFVGRLPHLLPIGCESEVHGAADIPRSIMVREYLDGAAPRLVTYNLHTLLHFGGAHYTAHGFVATGEPNGAPYVFLHDAIARPLVVPAPNYDVYANRVARVWYVRAPDAQPQ